MITVIVDTTATFSDVMMKKSRWMQLLTLCHNSAVHLVLPDVVLRETARHWEADVTRKIISANGKIGGIQDSRDKLTEMGIDASSLIDSAPITQVPDKDDFEAKQHEKLTSLGVQVKKVPDYVDIETVLQRDLKRKKPFTDSGKGFRDTLVWETVKDVVMNADPGDEVFFVTNNSNDYCDESGALEPELIAELEDADALLVRVADLEALLEHSSVAPKVAKIAKTAAELATLLAAAAGEGVDTEGPVPVGEVVKNAIMYALENLAGKDVETDNEFTSGLDFSELDLPGELEGLTVDVIEPDESTLTWQTYETYDDTTYLINAEIHASVSVDGFAYKSDVVYLEEEGKVHVLDWDWNSHMSHVAASTQAKLTFQVQLEHGMSHAESCELEGVEPVIDDSEHPYMG